MSAAMTAAAPALERFAVFLIAHHAAYNKRNCRDQYCTDDQISHPDSLHLSMMCGMGVLRAYRRFMISFFNWLSTSFCPWKIAAYCFADTV